MKDRVSFADAECVARVMLRLAVDSPTPRELLDLLRQAKSFADRCSGVEFNRQDVLHVVIAYAATAKHSSRLGMQIDIYQYEKFVAATYVQPGEDERTAADRLATRLRKSDRLEIGYYDVYVEPQANSEPYDHIILIA